MKNEMAGTTDIAEIFCDESGHDGENLLAGTTPVLAHSSLYMDLGEATDLVGYLRSKTKAQSPELKASDVLRNGQAIKELFGEKGKLVGHTQVYLVEKANFAIGKIIDLLIEEEAYRRGINLYAGGLAKQMADDLYEYGPRALGADAWNDLVAAFTSLMRTKQRKGGAKETVDGFFEKIDEYRLRSRREKVSQVLQLVWMTRSHADAFQQALAAGWAQKTLDPLQSSLFQLAYSWHGALKRPIVIMHDEQTALTEKLLRLLVKVANEGSPSSFNLPNLKFPLLDVKQIDSKTDPRIQLADIAAGFCRQVAENALRGNADQERLEQVRRFVHFNSVWGDAKSWEQIRPREAFGI